MGNKKLIAYKIMLPIAFLGAILSFGMVAVLVSIFFTAVNNGGSVLIDVYSYGEMEIEIFLVIPIVIITTAVSTLYTLHRTNYEMKQFKKN